MTRVIHEFSFALLVLVGVSFAGCGGAQTTACSLSAAQHVRDHYEILGDEHAHSESFAETLTEIDDLRAEVKKSFAADELDKADGPVHGIGHLLQELPQLAAKESPSESDRQQVKQAVDMLMESFAAVDERVHGGDGVGKSYDEVAIQIDEAIARLKAMKLPESQP